MAAIRPRGENIGGVGSLLEVAGAGYAALAAEDAGFSSGSTDHQDVTAELLGDDDFVRIQRILGSGVWARQFTVTESHVPRSVGPQYVLIKERDR